MVIAVDNILVKTSKLDVFIMICDHSFASTSPFVYITVLWLEKPSVTIPAGRVLIIVDSSVHIYQRNKVTPQAVHYLNVIMSFQMMLPEVICYVYELLVAPRQFVQSDNVINWRDVSQDIKLLS